MNLNLQYLPSYTVLALRMVVKDDEHVFENPLHAIACVDLLKFVKTSNLKKSAHPELHGLSMLTRDWSNKKDEPLLYDECVVLPTKPIALKDSRALVAALDTKLPTHLTSTPAGTYAVFRFKGDYTGLPAFFENIFDKELPANHTTYAGGPVLELYVNDHETTPLANREIDVCVPVVTSRGGTMTSVAL